MRKVRARKSSLFICLALILFCIVCCRRRNEEIAEKTASVEAEIANVQSVINRYIDALGNKDIELLSSIFAHDEDLVMFDGNVPERFIGWPAVKERFQEHFDSYDEVDIVSRDPFVRIHHSGQVAWISCVLDANLLIQGRQSSLSGLRVTWGLEKRNGDWVIVQAHFSLPRT